MEEGEKLFYIISWTSESYEVVACNRHFTTGQSVHQDVCGSKESNLRETATGWQQFTNSLCILVSTLLASYLGHRGEFCNILVLRNSLSTISHPVTDLLSPPACCMLHPPQWSDLVSPARTPAM